MLQVKAIAGISHPTGKVLSRRSEILSNLDLLLPWPFQRTETNGTVSYNFLALTHIIIFHTGKALLLAHGYRTEGTGLVADLAIKESFLKRLLKVTCSPQIINMNMF